METEQSKSQQQPSAPGAGGGLAAPTLLGMELFSAADAAEELKVSTTTAKQIARDVKMSVPMTKSGIWVLTRPMVEKIRSELERRKLERERYA
jgi:hypothetical protein